MTEPMPDRRDLLAVLTREAVDAGNYGEPAPETTDPAAWCGASMRVSFSQPRPYIGPCVLRAGHDGPVHQDEQGGQWTDPRPATVEDAEALCPPDPHPYVHLTYGLWEASGHQCGDIRPGGCDGPVPERKVLVVVGGVGEEHLVGWEFGDCPSCGPASALRDQLADALYLWAVGHTAGGARFLDGGTDKYLRQNSQARADAVLPVVEAAIADARARFLEMATRAEAQQERADEAEETAEQHARNTETVARERESLRQAWKDEQKKAAAARARAEQAERALAAQIGLYKSAEEDVDKAEATVARVRKALDDASYGGPEREDVVAEIRAALTPPEEP